MAAEILLLNPVARNPDSLPQVHQVRGRVETNAEPCGMKNGCHNGGDGPLAVCTRNDHRRAGVLGTAQVLQNSAQATEAQPDTHSAEICKIPDGFLIGHDHKGPLGMIRKKP
jgi:hypothetical protein